MAEKSWRRPSLVGPALLILVGGALLLGNLGLLRVNWWDLVRLWPAVLILVGLDMLAQHSRWGSVLVLLLTVALLAGLFYVMVSGPMLAPSFLSGSATRTERVAREVSQDLAGAAQVDVKIHMDAGELLVGALEDSPRLLEGTLSYPQGWQPPSLSYQVSDGRGHLELASRGAIGWAIPLGLATAGETWTLGLTREVPLDITVDAGATVSVLDLRHLLLKSLDLKAGVGRMEVYFPSDGTQMSARLDGGVGELTLHIPESVAARIAVDGGLGSLNLSRRFQRTGEHTYETAGYSTAESRLDVRVKGGVGSLRVK